jgi:hypothetical protein
MSELAEFAAAVAGWPGRHRDDGIGDASSDQKVASSAPFWDTANANASARRMAVAGSWQPSTGFQQNVEGTAPMC